MNILTSLQQVAAGALPTVDIYTNLNASAPIHVSPIPGAPDGATGQASGGSFSATRMLAWLQPKVAVQLPTGALAVAPFGEPSADYALSAIAGALAVALGIAAIGASGGRGVAKHLAVAAGISGVVAFVSSRMVSK